MAPALLGQRRILSRDEYDLLERTSRQRPIALPGWRGRSGPNLVTGERRELLPRRIRWAVGSAGHGGVALHDQGQQRRSQRDILEPSHIEHVVRGSNRVRVLDP